MENAKKRPILDVLAQLPTADKKAVIRELKTRLIAAKERQSNA